MLIFSVLFLSCISNVDPLSSGLWAFSSALPVVFTVVVFCHGLPAYLRTLSSLSWTACTTQRLWSLWAASWPCSSSVSTDWKCVHYGSLSSSLHFIFDCWIFKPLWFLHTLPQLHCILVVGCPLHWINCLVSVHLGSCSQNFLLWMNLTGLHRALTSTPFSILGLNWNANFNPGPNTKY